MNAERDATIRDILRLLRKSGMNTDNQGVLIEDGKMYVLAELDDGSGGVIAFPSEKLAVILKRLRLVRITSDKQKSSRRMLTELETIEREFRKGVFGK